MLFSELRSDEELWDKTLGKQYIYLYKAERRVIL